MPWQRSAAMNWIAVIHEVVERKIPFLGICLGLQLMFENSEETPGVAGTCDCYRAEIVRIPDDGKLKVPHIGWNSLHFPIQESRLFQGIEEDSYVYFVHSYYLKAGKIDRCSSNDRIWNTDSCSSRTWKYICLSVPSGKELRGWTADFEEFYHIL